MVFISFYPETTAGRLDLCNSDAFSSVQIAERVNRTTHYNAADAVTAAEKLEFSPVPLYATFQLSVHDWCQYFDPHILMYDEILK